MRFRSDGATPEECAESAEETADETTQDTEETPHERPPDPGRHRGDDQTPIGDPPSKRGPKRLLTYEADRPDPPYGKAWELSL